MCIIDSQDEEIKEWVDTIDPIKGKIAGIADHKICNDHYRNEKWQPFEPWTCNIDYLSPTDNMYAKRLYLLLRSLR